MQDAKGETTRSAGAQAFASLGLRAGDPDTLGRIRRALVSCGLSDPHPPGHGPHEAFGAYSTFLVIPQEYAVEVSDGIPEGVLDFARMAYSLGATRVFVWSEDFDRVLPSGSSFPEEMTWDSDGTTLF